MPLLERESRELMLFSRKVFIVAAVMAAAALLWRVRDIAFLVFVAAVLATAISPAVRRLQVLGRHYTRRKIGRGTAVLLVYLPVVILVGGLVAFIIPKLFAETRQMGSILPAVIEAKLLRPLESYIPMGEVRKMLAHRPAEFAFLPYLRSAVTLISSIVVVVVMTAYMLLDAERLRNVFLLLYPAERRLRKQRMIRRASRRMSAWLTGQLMLAGIMGLATFVALVALRIPYALPLALLAALGEFVPLIGPVAGAVPALTVALLHSSWQFWSYLIVAVLLQQIENHVLVPRMMGSIVSVSPLSVVIAFMIGGSLFGIPGAMMAVPLAAIIQVLFEESFLAQRERRQDRGRAGTLIKGSW